MTNTHTNIMAPTTRQAKKFYYKHLMVLASMMFLTACAVGPDFVAPTTQSVASYGNADVKQQGKQTISYHAPSLGPWWNQFHSTELTQVMQLGLRDNYDLASTQETLAQAKERVTAQTGQLWPQVAMNAGVGRQKYGVALFGPGSFNIPPFTYYELGPSVNLALDVFGGTRRSIEKQNALASYQDAEVKAAYLTLTGNIATTALSIATINEKITVTKEIIAEDNKNLKLVQQAFDLGATTRTEVLSAQSQSDNDQTLLPALYQQLVVAQDTLTVLMGKAPANWQPPHFTLSDFTLPKHLSLTLPSELVHKRPDILASEALLHAASADVGIATANLYPSINLSGSLLQEALTPGDLVKASSTAWSALGGLTAPIFEGGSLRATKRGSEHAFNAAYANYQQVVIKAFAQVNDIIHAIRNDELAVQVQQRAVETAGAGLRLARLSYNAGNVGVLQVLEAERLYTQARLGLVQAQAQRYQDTTQLYVAMGGVA